MGYYTNYALSAKAYNEKIPVERIRQLEDEIAVMNVFDEDGNYENGWYGFVKWYDNEEDMGLLSRRFPEFLFYLEGDGESYGDHWGCYYLNGTVMRDVIVTQYLDFDLCKTVPAEPAKSDRYTYQNN